MSRLSSLFEEDIEMQDALEDIETLTDDGEDILISNIEERYNEIRENKVHLFTNEADESEVNEDGLSPEEEAEFLASMLDNEDSDDPLSAEEIEDFMDDDY